VKAREGVTRQRDWRYNHRLPKFMPFAARRKGVRFGRRLLQLRKLCVRVLPDCRTYFRLCRFVHDFEVRFTGAVNNNDANRSCLEMVDSMLDKNLLLMQKIVPKGGFAELIASRQRGGG